MGADLIAYNLAAPGKGWKKVADGYLGKIEAVLKKAGDSEKLTAGEIEEEVAKEIVTELRKINKNIGKDLEENDGGTPLDIVAQVVSDLSAARDFTPEGFDYRDASSMQLKINGQEVFILYAGEMSWGDEPSGAGYQELKSVWRIGLGDLLWEAVPWDAGKIKKPRKPGNLAKRGADVVMSLLEAKSADEAHDLIVNNTDELQALAGFVGFTER